MSVETVRRCLAALEIRLELRPRWRGAELDRLLDEGHATLQAAWAARLRAWGWLVEVEVSFSRYGERGRIDLLAWHPEQRVLLVIEIKTEVADAQALLGGLDAKTRLAPGPAAGQGWRRPSVVVPALIVLEGATARRHVRRLEPLFARLGRRGKAAISWLRRPQPLPGGILIFSNLSPAATGRVRRHGSARVRVGTARRSVEEAVSSSSGATDTA